MRLVLSRHLDPPPAMLSARLEQTHNSHRRQLRPHDPHPQSHIPGRRAWHAVPAGDQGHAEGNAAGGRPAADPACGRRSAPGRHRVFHLRHRPQQGRHRGPFRPPIRARTHIGRARQEGRTRRCCRRTCPSPGTSSFTRQQSPLGLGHAVWCARELVGSEPFALLLPDVLVQHPRGCLAQMIDAAADLDGNANCLAVEEVPPDRVHMYGVVGVGPANGKAFSITKMVEKPNAAEAPSNLSITGRYILQPQIFDLLGKQAAGAGGEIQLTDAMIGAGAQPAVLRPEIRGPQLRLRLQDRLPRRQRGLWSGARRTSRRNSAARSSACSARRDFPATPASAARAGTASECSHCRRRWSAANRGAPPLDLRRAVELVGQAELRANSAGPGGRAWFHPASRSRNRKWRRRRRIAEDAVILVRRRSPISRVAISQRRNA